MKFLKSLSTFLNCSRENRNKYMTHSNSSLYGRYLFDTGDGRGYLLSEEDSNVDKDGSRESILSSSSNLDFNHSLKLQLLFFIPFFKFLHDS